MSTQTTQDLIYSTYVKKYGQTQADQWLKQQTLTPSLKKALFLNKEPKLHQSPSLRSPLSPSKQNISAISTRKSQHWPSHKPLNQQTTKYGYNWVDLNPEAITKQLTASLEGVLSKSQLKTFRLLHSSALSVAAQRAYSPSVTQVSFFCPAEIVAHARDIHRTTLWRQLKPMLELGLLDYRAHKTTHQGKTVTDGTIWIIKLHPNKGKAPRLSYQELKTKYRDLAADIDSGRTAFKQINSKMQQSNKLKEKRNNIQIILRWALTPLTYSNPVITDCCKTTPIALESVLDVAHAPKKDRNKMVDTAAKAISYALADSSSHRFYAKLLWNLLRRHDQGNDYFMQVYNMIIRARADQNEGFARSAGALFVSRLKEWEVWDFLQSTPMVRVGTRPMEA